MPTLKEIKLRVEGIRNTQKITRAMKIVATTRLKKLERAMAAKITFLEHLTNIYGELSRSAYDFDHPLLKPNEAKGKVALIVISSDRGLCGAFNSQLFRSMEEFIENDLKSEPVGYFVIGAKAEKLCKKSGKNILYSAAKVAVDARQKVATEIIDLAVEKFMNNELSEVYFVFNGFNSRSDFGFRTTPLLPFSKLIERLLKDEKRKGSRFLIEPSIESCLEVLIPFYLKTALMHAIMQSQTAEELSRMLAMDYATENAQELIHDLTLIYNRTRQAVITKEISEIVGGAEALK
ncbi:MAG: ATP synthase F1 subunit gamma [Candidatus Omnitrophica bacterium]|nr:ATP synthase F1 subunit gamma [Candidatus Omnitrophota bacterium]